MKSAQWTAVLVLILMVGGITFVNVYLGGRNRDADLNSLDPPPSLSFPFKSFPREGEKPPATEVGESGHQDYWFVNESAKDLAVGLEDKGCTCSDVEITVAPPSWLPRLACSAVTQAVPQSLHGLANLTTLAAARAHDQQFPDLPLLDPNGAATRVLTRENSIVVPAGAIGRVRLSWRQNDPKPLLTYAGLWIGRRDGGASARLEMKVRVAEPIQVAKEASIPAVTIRQLATGEGVRPTWIYCWSLTRPSFPLKVETIHHRLKPESDAVEVGQPIPLSEAELRRLQDDNIDKELAILSGYKIPVTLKASAKDGTPIEWGSFQRLVRVSSDTEGFEPVIVQLTGEVEGDIAVSGGKLGSKIDLGPFPSKRGARGDVILHTDDKKLDLELDVSRLPSYLSAKLGKPADTAGHRSWVLYAEVRPNAAHGDFPRSDDPIYLDSAIYVKTKEKQPRSVRVPVVGTANEG